jgi:stage II sporulation protein D
LVAPFPVPFPIGLRVARIFGRQPHAPGLLTPRPDDSRPQGRRSPGPRSSGPRSSGLRPLGTLAVAVGLVVGLGGLGTALVALAAPLPGGSVAWGSRQRSEGQGVTLRVLLQQATGLEAFAPSAPLQLLDSQGRSLAQVAPGGQLRIRRQGGVLWLERPEAAPQPLVLQELWLEPAPQARGGAVARMVAALQPAAPLVGLERRRYRGRLQIRPEGAQLQAVNHIPLELYLPSVVGSEMPARWPAAALRAQAVAARTYALAQLRPAAPFDLRSTVASQAYLGVEAETDSTRAAVAATRSQVLRHGGRLIDAVFHSSSGGSTENSGEMWNRQLPYLVSVPDQDSLSPWHQWRLRIEPEQLRRAFQEIEGANRIEVLATSSTGRVRRARVIGPAGSLDLSGVELRQRLGLRSTLVRFRFADTPAAAGGGGISAAIVAAQAEPASLGRVPSSDRRAPAPPLPPLPPLLSPAAELFPLPALEVEGRGFGHGVGMSQWGAYGLALRGFGYEQILRHYYRGAELVSAPTR